MSTLACGACFLATATVSSCDKPSTTISSWIHPGMRGSTWGRFPASFKVGITTLTVGASSCSSPGSGRSPLDCVEGHRRLYYVCHSPRPWVRQNSCRAVLSRPWARSKTAWYPPPEATRVGPDRPEALSRDSRFGAYARGAFVVTVCVAKTASEFRAFASQRRFLACAVVTRSRVSYAASLPTEGCEGVGTTGDATVPGGQVAVRRSAAFDPATLDSSTL